MVADRLSLAHWQVGHRIVVCALAGGTGRTTLAGLLATVMAELPFAHVWPPIALTESSPRTLSTTAKRWDVLRPPEPDQPAAQATDSDRSVTASGVHVLASPPSVRQPRDYSVVVVDAPVGMPSDITPVATDPTASVLLVIRPDRASLTEAAEALVWMNDHHLVGRRRVSVVINYGVGPADHASKAAAAALGIRCAAVHRLAQEPLLAPGRPLPSGRALPSRLRRGIARLCLDIWSQSQASSTPAAVSSPHP